MYASTQMLHLIQICTHADFETILILFYLYRILVLCYSPITLLELQDTVPGNVLIARASAHNYSKCLTLLECRESGIDEIFTIAEL